MEKYRTIYNITIFPIYGCKTKPPMNFSQDICNYTEQGRKKIHKNLRGYKHLIRLSTKNSQMKIILLNLTIIEYH